MVWKDSRIRVEDPLIRNLINNYMADKSDYKTVFPQGLRVFPPRPNAPDFVVGDMVIFPTELMEWISAEGQEWLTEYQGKAQLKLKILRNKNNEGINIMVDTYRKPDYNGEAKPYTPPTGASGEKPISNPTTNTSDNGDIDELPF